MSVIATDNFDRADASDLGSNWTAANNAPGGKITSNRAIGALSGYQAAFWNANAFPNDQYAEITKSGTQYVAPFVRGDSNSGGNGYAFFDAAAGLQKVVNGSWSSLTGALSPSPGDRMRIEVIGTSIAAKINGTDAGGTTDASLTAGAAGIAFYDATAPLDDWEGGDLSSAPIAGVIAEQASSGQMVGQIWQ